LLANIQRDESMRRNLLRTRDINVQTAFRSELSPRQVPFLDEIWGATELQEFAKQPNLIQNAMWDGTLQVEHPSKLIEVSRPVLTKWPPDSAS
jgi:hypothetical protein